MTEDKIILSKKIRIGKRGLIVHTKKTGWKEIMRYWPERIEYEKSILPNWMDIAGFISMCILIVSGVAAILKYLFS